jgi:hypothetical protein
MTESQNKLFSSKLAALPELGNDAPIGGSTEAYAKTIANELRDSEKQKKYSKHLAKLGFNLK